MSTKKKDNGDQVETPEHSSVEEERLRREARSRELQPHAHPDDRERNDKERKDRERQGKDADVIQQQSPRGLERIDNWSPERKAHAEKVAKACADLYQFVLDNPVIEGILSSKVTGVTSSLGDPLFTLQEMGVEIPKRRRDDKDPEDRDRRWEREQREQRGETQHAF